MMKAIISISIFLSFSSFIGVDYTDYAGSDLDTEYTVAFYYLNDGCCPDPNAVNHSIVEDFLTKPYWSSERTEANTGNLSVSQITLLTDSGDGNACTSFNTIYQEALDEENGQGERAHNVTYYKAGSFYFVVITPRQSDTPNYITMGVSYIHLYNQNYDLIKAYAF